jgi:hypothetical protein
MKQILSRSLKEYLAEPGLYSSKIVRHTFFFINKNIKSPKSI